MKKWKRFAVAVLAFLMVSGVMCSCGKTGDDTPDVNDQVDNTPTPDNNQTDTETQATGSVYYLSFKPEQADDWIALAQEYTNQTGVQVNVQTAAANGYESTLKSEMAKTQAPTLFQVNGPVGLASWKDYCYDLTNSELYGYLKSDDFALTEGGKVYGIAYAIETYGIIYNKSLLAAYCDMENAVITDASDIDSFDMLKKVVEDIQKHKEDLGINGAFTSAGMDASSDWRFKTHLANLPIYYEYKDEGIGTTNEIKGTYLDNYKKIWDLYISNSTTKPSLLSGKTGSDAEAEFALGEAVFFQNGTWEYQALIDAGMMDEDLGILPIYIGVEGEENQGLCTGSENYWCVNAKASEEDIQATLDFLAWLVSSDTGRDTLANVMGFVTPFTTFDENYMADNPLIRAANDYIDAGKTSVSWNFATIPSEQWKNNVGSALLEYAQGTGKWDAVEKAFVEGWKTEAEAAGIGAEGDQEGTIEGTDANGTGDETNAENANEDGEETGNGTDNNTNGNNTGDAAGSQKPTDDMLPSIQPR